MNVVVVYESMYGNTHHVAEAIAEGLDALGAVRVLPLADAASMGDVDLLVVGGPTHVHGMSKAASRKAAVETAANDDALDLDPDAPGPGLRTWLADLPKVDGAFAAAFDTRADGPPIFTGSAAKGIAKQLRRHRFGELTEPVSFVVENSEGPLKEGEIERARQWGVDLAQRCRDQVTTG